MPEHDQHLLRRHRHRLTFLSLAPIASIGVAQDGLIVVEAVGWKV